MFIFNQAQNSIKQILEKLCDIILLLRLGQ